MADPLILTDTVGRVRTLCFNRPDQLNAMSTPMIFAIVEAMEAAEADEAIGAVVITGAGKAFMAGADIKEYAGLDEKGFRRFQRDGRRVYEALERSGKPVIAAINGYALGGGFEIALAADVIVARRGAKMGLPEVKLDLIPGGGGTQRLARRIGPNRAFELLATGEALPAETFADLGLVSHLTDGDPMDKALALATTMAGHAPAALKAIKSLTQLAGESALGAALDREAEALHHLFLTTDARKHIAAFAAKSEARRAEKEAKS